MRMYALYERSRKVLALYIVIVVATLVVAGVSFNLRRISTQSDIPLLMSWYIVVNSDSKTRSISGQANTHRLLSKFGSRRVSTSDVGSKFIELNSLVTPFLQSHP